MSKKKEGVCHICGKVGPLSFEHIPPRSMGNSVPTKSYSVVEMAKKHHTLSTSNKDGVRYRQQQKGIGFQTICRECNSYLGKHYVKAYTGCVSELGSILAMSEQDGKALGIHLESHNVPVLAFFKHVISNFCTTTQPGSMLDCRDFLLNYESNAFPERYRVFMFAIPEKSPFISSGWTKALLGEGGLKTAAFAFIAAPPVGFYLYDTEASTASPVSSRYGCEITPMAKQPWGAKPNFALDLPYMTTSNSFPVPLRPQSS